MVVDDVAARARATAGIECEHVHDRQALDDFVNQRTFAMVMDGADASGEGGCLSGMQSSQPYNVDIETALSRPRANVTAFCRAIDQVRTRGGNDRPRAVVVATPPRFTLETVPPHLPRPDCGRKGGAAAARSPPPSCCEAKADNANFFMNCTRRR